jgi:hypothetical protein
MKKFLAPLLLIGGGAATAAVVWYGMRKSDDTTSAIEQILNTGSAVDSEGTHTSSIQIRATGYYPFQEGLTPAQRKMEGAPVDRKGKPLFTLEDFLAGRSEYVSLSGDFKVFPYGQKLILDWNGKKIIGRVTDTGSHFFGVSKVYRALGHEPIDVCVESSKTIVPKLITGQIISGDNFEGGKVVATAGLKGQTITGDVDES